MPSCVCVCVCARAQKKGWGMNTALMAGSEGHIGWQLLLTGASYLLYTQGCFTIIRSLG